MKHQGETNSARLDARRRKFLSSTAGYAFLASLRGVLPAGALFFEMAEAFAATEAELKAKAEHVMLLGTTEVLVIGHTRCGMLSLAEDEVHARLAAEGGVDVAPPLLEFHDLAENVRRQLALIRSHPWLKRDAPVHGLIYDVETGRLQPVE